MDRLFGAAAIAVGLAVGFAGAPAGVDNGPGLATSGVSARAAVPGASQPRPVTLINGDRLLAGAGPGGAISHELMAGTARGINAQLVTLALGGTTSTIWTDQYFQQAALFANSGGQFDQGRTFTPGERVTENWGAFPLHVAPNVNLIGARNPDPFLLVSAARTGNKLGFYLTPFSENQPGYTGSGYLPIPHVKVSGRYEIDENGKMIASGDPAHPETVNGEFGAVVTVSPRPSVIRLLLTAQRSGAGYPLSSASRTVWTWRSVHEAGSTVPAGWYCPTSFRSAISFTRSCAAEPMMTLRYAIAGLSLDGSTTAGRQVLHVTAGHLPLAKATAVTSAAVSVSFDGGKTWHPATVTGHDGSYTATFTAPAGAKVSLRTSASDAAGGSITETLMNAYQISS